MKAYSINPLTQELKEIDIEIKIDTAYSFFSSLLIDEASTIAHHVIYADANALNENKTPYFIGGGLILGEALIVGRNGLEDIEASIPIEDLKALINYDVPEFYKDVIELIFSTSNVNFYRTFSAKKGDEIVDLSIEWVLYTFNIADEATKNYFVSELKKVVDSKEDIPSFMQKMAQLALNAI